MLYFRTSSASRSETVKVLGTSVPEGCSSSISAVNDPDMAGPSSLISVILTVSVVVVDPLMVVALWKTQIVTPIRPRSEKRGIRTFRRINISVSPVRPYV